jgi:hypothetical protein
LPSNSEQTNKNKHAMGFQCEFNICSIFLNDHVFEGFSTRDFFLILHSKIEKPKKLRLIISKKSKKKKLVQNNPSFLPTGKSLELGHGDSIERN